MARSPIVPVPVVRKWPLRLLWLAAFCFLLSTFCFVFRSPLLTGLANAWIVNEPLVKADAILVLGGGLESRPFEAARLYREGLAPKILFMNVRTNPTTRLGVTLWETELTRRVLLSNNVPESAMGAVGNGVTNTHEESCAIRSWLRTNAAKSLIITTELFHTRRVRWMFRRELKGTGVQVRIAAVTPNEYAATNWWQREQGMIAFQNEILKSAYYVFHY